MKLASGNEYKHETKSGAPLLYWFKVKLKDGSKWFFDVRKIHPVPEYWVKEYSDADRLCWAAQKFEELMQSKPFIGGLEGVYKG